MSRPTKPVLSIKLAKRRAKKLTEAVNVGSLMPCAKATRMIRLSLCSWLSL